MRKVIPIIVLLLSAQVVAAESSEDGSKLIIEMMVVAKATGMCGAFSQMVNFQQTTKMKGGDEFMVRFLTTEAARLGHTLESFMSQCPEVVKKYNANMKLLGYEE